MVHDQFQFTLIHRPNIAGSYAILLFTASDLASISSHIHNRVLSHWVHLLILSGVIPPPISSSILGTERPGEFIFLCPIFLPFHTVHGVLKARILKWFAIPFSSGRHSVRPLHHDPSVLGGPIFKSRGITLPTKVRLVKAMVFPVVVYGYESWTIKKAERQRIDAFEQWCWRRLLRVPWTARRSNQSILKEISPEYLLEGLMLKLKLQLWPPDMKN